MLRRAVPSLEIPWRLSLVAAIVVAACCARACRAEGTSGDSFRIVFSTECNSYFDWQTLALLHSYTKVGQAERITRLMACDRDDYPGASITDAFPGADTYVHPNRARHPTSGDVYPAYNKPFSVLHWLEHDPPSEEYVVFLDADMVIVNAITLQLLGVARGRPVSALYDYLKGVDASSRMAIRRSVPNVERAQKVGGFQALHAADLATVAPLWLHYTEDVREDPANWVDTGDVYSKDGANGPPWIAEMYGYVFACAHANLTHTVSPSVMLYPGYSPPEEPFPLVLHYGITFFVEDYAFSKAWFTDLTSCDAENVDLPLSLEEISHQVSQPQSHARHNKQSKQHKHPLGSAPTVQSCRSKGQRTAPNTSQPPQPRTLRTSMRACVRPRKPPSSFRVGRIGAIARPLIDRASDSGAACVVCLRLPLRPLLRPLLACCLGVDEAGPYLQRFDWRLRCMMCRWCYHVCHH